MSADHPVEVPDFSKEDLEAIRKAVREGIQEGMAPLRDFFEQTAAFYEKVHRVVEQLEERKAGK